MSDVTEILDVEFGKVVCLKNDIGQYHSFRSERRSQCYHEAHKLLAHTVDASTGTLIDVGANIGGFGFTVRDKYAYVVMVEAQPLLADCCKQTIEINKWENIDIVKAAVSNCTGELDVPRFDYSMPLGFGSIEFMATQKEILTQSRRPSIERVRMDTLDNIMNAYPTIPAIRAIKIDVEGMETAALEGMSRLIMIHKPVMLIEHLKSRKEEIVSRLNDYGYRVAEDIGLDYLCVPR